MNTQGFLYNKKRIKEKLDGLSPVEYRKNFEKTASMLQLYGFISLFQLESPPSATIHHQLK
jgi:hypothetical protein